MPKRRIDEEDGGQTCHLNPPNDLIPNLHQDLPCQGLLKKRLWVGEDQLGRHDRDSTGERDFNLEVRPDADGHSSIKQQNFEVTLGKDAELVGQDEKQSKSSDAELAAGLQNTQPSRHLVKTLSDLPKLVAIAGYNVASYTIDDEPHLCLPNLLQFIQQKYPLDKVIDVFETTVTNFKSATPKQIEGFIKAIALPLGSRDCPLIRMSDAEKVCQALSDRSANDQAVSKSSPKLNRGKNNFSSDNSKATASSDTHSRGSGANFNSKFQDVSGSRLTDTSFQNNNEHRETKSAIGGFPPSAERERLVSRSEPPMELRDFEASYTDRPPHLSNRTMKETTSEIVSDCLFGSENGRAILNLARAATSTLRIKVFHRCFGKCSGFFYPSRLRHSESRCIECATCFQLLAPKKFIRHTHGSREENVFHWGFDINHWRHYINLYRNQDMNNLDEDELLVQLNKLKSAPDKDQSLSGDEESSVQRDEKSSNSDLNDHTVKHDKSSHNKSFQEPIKLLPPSSLPSTRNSIPRSIHERKSSAIQSNYPVGIVKPTVFNPATSVASISSILENLAGKHRMDTQRGPHMWPIGQSSMSRAVGKQPSDQHTLDASLCLNPPQYPLNNLLANPILFSHHFDQAGLRPDSYHLPVPRMNPVGSDKGLVMFHQSDGRVPPALHINASYQADRFIKQDLFLSSSLATYLSSRRLDGDLVRDIIEQTLDAARKSRLLF